MGGSKAVVIDSRGEWGMNLIAEISGEESSTAASKDTKAMGVETPVVRSGMGDGLGRVKAGAPVSQHFQAQHGSGA